MDQLKLLFIKSANFIAAIINIFSSVAFKFVLDCSRFCSSSLLLFCDENFVNIIMFLIKGIVFIDVMQALLFVKYAEVDFIRSNIIYYIFLDKECFKYCICKLRYITQISGMLKILILISLCIIFC